MTSWKNRYNTNKLIRYIQKLIRNITDLMSVINIIYQLIKNGEVDERKCQDNCNPYYLCANTPLPLYLTLFSPSLSLSFSSLSPHLSFIPFFSFDFNTCDRRGNDIHEYDKGTQQWPLRFRPGIF